MSKSLSRRTLLRHAGRVPLALAAVALAHSRSDAQPQQGLRIALSLRDESNYDPADIGSFVAKRPVNRAIFNGLVRWAPGNESSISFEPDLALGWSSTQDARTWRFQLRSGVMFHRDYGEFTSDDVAFSYERQIDPKFGKRRWANVFSNITGIETSGKYAVTFHLKDPDIYFVGKVTNLDGGYIVSKKAADELGATFPSHPVGTGPFVFQEYRPNDRILLSKHSQYFRGGPQLNSIEYVFEPDPNLRLLGLLNKELHAAELDPNRVVINRVKAAGLVVDDNNLDFTPNFCFHLNLRVPPLNDVRVRTALAYVVDRTQVVAVVPPGVADSLLGVVPTYAFGALRTPPDLYPTNIVKARAVLAEAGHKNGLTIGPVLISEAWQFLRPMQILQAQWREAGVDLRLQQVDHATWVTRIFRDTSIPVIPYAGARLPYAGPYLDQFFHSRAAINGAAPASNFSGYAGVDDLLDRADETDVAGEQLRLWTAAQNKILADVPAIPCMGMRIVMARQRQLDLGYVLKWSLVSQYSITEQTRLQ